MIDYPNTHRLYDKYYDDIEELRKEAEFNLGKPLKIEGDLKGWFVCFGFEHTAYSIANDLNLEI